MTRVVGVAGPVDECMVARLCTRRATCNLQRMTHYYAGIIEISHARPAGAGSCAGCEQPCGIFIKSFTLHGPQGQIYGYVLNSRAAPVLDAAVNWQCEGQPTFVYDFEFGWMLSGWEFSNCQTAVQRPTWGAIKHLYR